MKTSVTTLATAALAAALLALAPGRAAADPAAVFVSNYNGANGYVSAYSATGSAATGYTATTNFSDAQGVAYNPANGTLYLADLGQSEIFTFNAATGAETQIGFANAAGISAPYGLALNAGVLYVANYGASTVTAYNAANGATVTSGFTAPTGLSQPIGLAVNTTTLFVVNAGSRSLGAYNLATGASVFSVTNLTSPRGVAVFGNDLFVANGGSANTVGEYDATTGAVINASFVAGLNAPVGLAILGNRLLVANEGGNTVGAYGIPAVATNGNVPTSSTPSFLTGLNGPDFVAVVPEPSACALLGVGAAALGVALLRWRWTVRA